LTAQGLARAGTAAATTGVGAPFLSLRPSIQRPGCAGIAKREAAMKTTTHALTITLLGAVATFLACASAHAQLIKQIQERQEAELAKDVEYTNKTCGSGLTVQLDWSAAPVNELEKFSAEGYCDAALEGVRRICTDAPGKDAVKQGIKHITC